MEPVDPRGPKEELLAEVDWVKVDALCRTGTNPSLPKRKIYKKIIQQLKIRQIEKKSIFDEKNIVKMTRYEKFAKKWKLQFNFLRKKSSN